MTTPREGCPAWCTSKHSGEDAVESHVDLRMMSDGYTWVALTMNARDGQLLIHVSNHQTGKRTKSLFIKPRDAADAAELFARLGHEDIAAAIEELAALAMGGAR